jgi:hypothetical protein
MDVFIAHKALGAVLPPAPKADPNAKSKSNSMSNTVMLSMAVSLCLGVYAAYLSWSSNGMVNRALAAVAPGSEVGLFTNAIYAMNAFFNGIFYLIYYYFAKLGRVSALKVRFS